ncbi:Nucleoside permease NupX [Pirellulimonas nuda]|uniref:Nucleoside permease NupX n=1 Tax=Pirellulimonas nuda TaxID=2528009 RepID=A0A518DEQ3_9BACT|nr:nucleoside transporter C-terminal domain-containing protein [Pirellulimonas nuda]QDU89946.1 Nucleoside permease NupX [Pirellulimonas nuda]
MPPQLISFFGLFVMIGLAWLMSAHKTRVSWRVVIAGLALQFVFALLILKTQWGVYLFEQLGEVFNRLLLYIEEGASLMFSVNARQEDPELPPRFLLLRTFAFGVLPTIIVFSSLMSILYHLGIMQRVIGALAWVMRRTLGTSGAETLSAAANIFVGQTEAPLVIRPYVATMTMSELMVVMVGGFATIAGGVLAIYVQLLGPGYAGHLLTASVISAPAALLIAKVLQPEVDHPVTADPSRAGLVEEPTPAGPTASSEPETPKPEMPRAGNVLEAAAEGASSGMALALNVAAMLITFVALVAMLNGIVGWAGGRFGFTGDDAWTLQQGFGYGFAPLAWAMGIQWSECVAAGAMLGEKMVLNEFYAYLSLSNAVKQETLSPRTITILTYALCGFANFSSIGIQLGGIGGIAPQRRSDLAKLGLRAMLGGTLAAFMTACIAGILL